MSIGPHKSSRQFILPAIDPLERIVAIGDSLTPRLTRPNFVVGQGVLRINENRPIGGQEAAQTPTLGGT